MSKTEELAKKMGQKPAVTFTPRESVAVRPIVPESPAVAPTPKPAEAAPKPEEKPAKPELVPLYTKIPKEDKRWLDHHKIDSGQELGEIVSAALQLLKKQSSK